jgi:hypothetical protein
MGSFRGLRCALIGKFADSPGSAELVSKTGRLRVDLGIAHIAVALVYPSYLRETEFAQLGEALAQAEFSFLVIAESGEGAWRSGGVRDLSGVLRAVHDRLVSEESLLYSAAELSTRLEEMSEAVIDDHSACDCLLRTLETGYRHHVDARH